MKCIICVLLIGFVSQVQAQYSSTDIRHASGHGPYPITFNFQRTHGGNKRLLQTFIHDFDDKYHVDNNTSLVGFSGNLEIVIASQHFLRMFGGEGLNIQGMKIGFSYHYLYNNVHNDQNLRLHLQQETIGLSLGYRMNLLYPFTCEIIAGPTMYNFATVTDHHDNNNDVNSTVTKFRIGTGIFERDHDRRDLCSGLDAKLRLNLFDPGGTEGGLGVVFEYGRVYTFGKRDLTGLYNQYLDDKKPSKKSWDYGYFSCGVIFPVACRIISR